MKDGKDMTQRPGWLGLILGCLAALGIGMAWPGCASTGAQTQGGARAEEFIAYAQPVVTVLVAAVLDRNPRYEPVLLAVADGVGVALQQQQLTADNLRHFTGQLAVRFPELEPQDQLMIQIGLSGLYSTWRARGGAVAPSDSETAKALLAVRQAILDAIAMRKPRDGPGAKEGGTA